MKASKHDWDADDWLGRCAWCGRRIPEDQEVFGLSMKFRPGMARPEWAGTVQPLRLVVSGKTIPMLVVSEDSPAKRAGHDAYFQVCSESCGQQLQPALRNEIELGDVLSQLGGEE